ncbi:MAG: MBL fold metallo-hydrolase [Gemmatimonadales bacterium]|jgi:hydroxyacylglutathione hydrolase
MAEIRGASAPERRGWAPDLEIVRADNASPMTLDGTRSYVLGRHRVAIIDPGPDDPRQLDALAAAVDGRPVGVILLTHAHGDHAAGMRAAIDRFGAEPAGSPDTLRRLGLDGIALADGDTLSIEPEDHDGPETRVTALHTPGHSADHVCFLAEPGRRLFTGDLVLGEGSSAILHPDGSVADCLASLARLVALRPALLLPGHGPPVRDATRRLEAYRRHRLEREAQVREALGRGAGSVTEVRDAVYGELPAGLRWAADASVAAHLAALAARGEQVPPYEGFGAMEEDHA